MRNYILVSANEELLGNIQAEYNLKIPSNKTITITNKLGNIEISNIEGEIELNTKYSNTTFNKVNGNIKMYSNIGELVLKDCNLKSNIETKYVTSYYQNISGSYELTSNLGSVNFTLNSDITSLNIESTGTEINLLNKSCIEFNLNLSANRGNIFIDKCSIAQKVMITTDSREDDKDKKVFIYSNPDVKPLITVSNKFANISIQ